MYIILSTVFVSLIVAIIAVRKNVVIAALLGFVTLFVGLGLGTLIINDSLLPWLDKGNAPKILSQLPK